MSQTTIHQVIGIDGNTLLVFVAQAYCWQLGLISPGGVVFGRKIYYTAEAALKAGIEGIAWGS